MGGNECSICERPDMDAISADLKAGMSVREAGEKHGIPKSTMDRHRRVCIPRAEIARTAIQRRQDQRADVELQTSRDLAAELSSLKAVIADALQTAVERGKLPLPLVRELRNTQELLLKTQLLLEQRGTATEPGMLEIVRVVEAAEKPAGGGLVPVSAAAGGGDCPPLAGAVVPPPPLPSTPAQEPGETEEQRQARWLRQEYKPGELEARVRDFHRWQSTLPAGYSPEDDVGCGF